MLMQVPPLAQENCRHSLKSEIGRKNVSLYLHLHILSMNFNLFVMMKLQRFSKYLKKHVHEFCKVKIYQNKLK